MDVIGSGIAIAQIASQLANGLIKLHDFWNDMCDAPDEIANIIRDLKSLSSLLKDIERQQHHGPTLLGTLECCEDKIKVLMNIVRKLEPNFRSEIGRVRYWYKFKAARKKEALKEFRDSLQETKITLILALTPACYMPPVYVRDSAVSSERIGAEDFSNERPQILAQNRSYSDPELPLYSQATSTPTDFSTDLALHGGSKPTLTPNYSESRLPLRYASKKTNTFPADSKANGKSLKYNRDHHSTSTSASDIQDCIRECVEQALMPMASKGFDPSEFAKAVNGTIQQASVILATGYDHHALPNFEAPQSFVNAEQSSKWNFTASNDYKEIHHEISATETLFGTVWLRTSRAKMKNGSKSTKGYHRVTSFVYYPSWWLTNFGLKNGIEISMSTSTKGWQLSLGAFRAVPDNALIFDFAQTGNIEAVKRLLIRGEASLQDTNSEGWTPLHFAAAAAHVELSEFLINEGADKSALAYKGPSKNALTPLTIFGEKAQAVDADQKIAMLRLFLEDLDPSIPSDEGWTVVGSLVRSQGKENRSLSQNSLFWLLRRFVGCVIRFGARSVWHGVQHAVRSFQFIAQDEMVRQKVEELGMNETLGISHVRSIARWIGLQVAARYLLPIQLIAGAILHIEGFDWVGDTPEPSPTTVDKQIPFLFERWTETFIDCIERVEPLTAMEFERVTEQIGRTPTRQGTGETPNLEYSQRPYNMSQLRCSTCKDDYTSLGMGLIEPRWITFAECAKAKHRFRCVCSGFPRRYYTGRTGTSSPERHMHQDQDDDVDAHGKVDDDDDDSPLIKPTSSEEEPLTKADGIPPREEIHSDSVMEMEERTRTTPPDPEAKPITFANNNNPHTKDPTPLNSPSSASSPHNAEPSDHHHNNNNIFSQEEQEEEEEKRAKEEEQTLTQILDQTLQSDSFQAAAYQLYRVQGRHWTSTYEIGERLCGECFLRREGYGGEEENNFFGAIPLWFRTEAESE